LVKGWHRTCEGVGGIFGGLTAKLKKTGAAKSATRTSAGLQGLRPETLNVMTERRITSGEVIAMLFFYGLILGLLIHWFLNR
jgi:hypothetical protein